MAPGGPLCWNSGLPVQIQMTTQGLTQTGVQPITLGKLANMLYQ